MALVLLGSVSQLDSYHSGAEGLRVKPEQGLLGSTRPLVHSRAHTCANGHMVTKFFLVSVSANSTVHADWIQPCARQIIAQSLWVQVTDITRVNTCSSHTTVVS